MSLKYSLHEKYFLWQSKLPDMKLHPAKNSILFSLLLIINLPVSLSYANEVLPVTQVLVFDLDKPKASPVAFQSLSQMDELVQLGMPALALRLLTHEQKKWSAYTSDWYAFERKRITLLVALEDWQRIIDRIELLFQEAIPGQQIGLKVSQWFGTQQIMAKLRLGQAETALSQLRKLLWSSSQVLMLMYKKLCCVISMITAAIIKI